MTTTTTWEVVRWWEIRRLLYNAILFVIGIASVLAMEWFMGKVIPVGEDAVEPFVLVIGITAYAIAANLGYSLGCLTELWGKRIDAVRARRRSEKLFRVGLWLSCLLTTAPFWFGLVFMLVHRKS